MGRKERSRSYEEFNDDGDEGNKQSAGFFEGAMELDREETNDSVSPEEEEEEEEEEARESSPPMRFSKSCLKNLFMVVLIFIYLLLTGVAFFLAYQTISDFLEKVNHPVMSVTYKEVDSFSPPGIALYPGRAELLSCRHHFHDYIPPLVEPGTHQEGECVTQDVTYDGPFSNQTLVRTA
ncbi:proton-activated chloride channel, partial [Notothenia coriiceps]|uniref:Proton-activated chloride channel n=1 Tax=Notothenia coriiceps TaxID=8208 RepID=A0A6I9P930_9TELE